MTDEQKRDEVFSKVWRACDTFRGVIDPSQYKDYILTMLFVKYLSDVRKSKQAEFEKKSSKHISGFVFGLGAAAAGFYLYKKNQEKVDAFLRRQGIQVPKGSVKDDASMTLEELALEKERLEDLIAEREHAAQQDDGGPQPVPTE